MELPPNPMFGIDEGATRALGTHRARATLLDTQSEKAARLESAASAVASAGPAAWEVLRQWTWTNSMERFRPPSVTVEPTATGYAGMRYQNFRISERSTATSDRKFYRTLETRITDYWPGEVGNLYRSNDPAFKSWGIIQ